MTMISSSSIPLNRQVVYIGIGGTHCDLALESIESLRNRGGYGGGVVLLTDQDIEIIGDYIDVVNVSPVDYLHHPPMKAKAWKARLFEVVEADDIIFFDADIRINRSIDPLWDATFDDAGLFWVAARWHSGVMRLHRRRSAELLSAWDHQLRNEQFSGDERALRNVVGKYNITQLPGDWLTIAHTTNDLHTPMLTHFTTPRRHLMEGYTHGVS